MTLHELVGKRVDVSAEETYTEHVVIDTQNPLFMVIKNRAGTHIFVAWNSISEIRHYPSDRRKPRTPKAPAGTGTAGGGPGNDAPVH